MSRFVGRSAVRWACALLVPLVLATPGAATAHGPDPGPPDATLALGGWSFDVEIWLPVLLAAWAYWAARRRVDRLHPGNPVPRWRWWSWLAGLATLVLALQSPIERYDTTLFSVHMVQHLLLTLVAPPLLLLAAPVTLLLRAATPEARRRVVLPVLHSRALRVLTNPLVTWLLFALVMWGSHFSPLFDAALEDPVVHLLEHALYLGTALLFWYPVVAADPGPNRLPHPARVGYLALGMPFGSFLGLAIFSASTILYPHYVTIGRTWGPTPLEDQALAGGIMWAGGDLIFLVALIIAVGAWLRSEEAEGRRVDDRLDRAARTRAADPSPAADGP
jgi:putative copper resistance protein D